MLAMAMVTAESETQPQCAEYDLNTVLLKKMLHLLPWPKKRSWCADCAGGVRLHGGMRVQ